MKSQEQIILENLVYNPEYTKKVIPFLKEEYFSDEVEKKVFVNIKQYVDQYNSPPTVNALNILLEGDKSLVGDTFENSVDYVCLLYTSDAFYLMHSLFRLTLTLDTITLTIMKNGLSFTREKKRRSRSTWTSLIRSLVVEHQ